MTRKALPLLTAAMIAGISFSAKAQFSAYATVTVDQLRGISTSPILQTLSPAPCSPTFTTNCTAYNDTTAPIGFTLGASYDVKTFGPVTLAADVRGSRVHDSRGAQTNSIGSGTLIYSGLGGVKATFRTPMPLLRPYVQGSAGYARSNFGVLTDAVHNGTVYPVNSIYPGIPTKNGLEYHGYAGLDLHLLPSLDIRAFEFGYGAIQSFGTFSHTYPVLSVSAGLVVHFPPRP